MILKEKYKSKKTQEKSNKKKRKKQRVGCKKESKNSK